MRSLAFILLMATNLCFGQVNKLIPGPDKPGFQSITRFDKSRPAVVEQEDTTKGRIIQINFWYPSSGGSKRMAFDDYVSLAGKELSPSLNAAVALQKGIDTYFAWPASTGADKKAFTSFLAKKDRMLAHGLAPLSKKKAPLILLVHGFAADYAFMAEHLASHGNFVLQVPVKGTKTYELDYEGKGLDTQVKDYEFAMQVIRRELGITPESLIIVGFSFGGQSAVALSLRQKNTRAVISLDGDIGSTFGADLLRRQPYYNEKLITYPIMHLYNAQDTYTELAWFNTIQHAPRLLIAMNRMQHGHFTTFGLLNNVLPGIMGKNITDPGNGYEAVIHLTQQFIAGALAPKSQFVNAFIETQVQQFPWIKDCIEKKEIRQNAS